MSHGSVALVGAELVEETDQGGYVEVWFVCSGRLPRFPREVIAAAVRW
ncbi:MAG: hypothetical protein QOK45_661, partial [Mycobacterium sp.]|nr:hypothetical protein [Mycobacterium sp.]